jgi:hypothetical protein
MNGEPMIDEPLVLPFTLIMEQTEIIGAGRMARLRRPRVAPTPIGEALGWVPRHDTPIKSV